MNSFKGLIALSVFFISFLSIAQEEIKPNSFISDELFIYMHAGSGKNYRILGTITSGSEVTSTGQEANDYTQIIDPKGKKAWVESKYISTNPSLRTVIAELNTKLANYAEVELTNEATIADASNSISK